MSINTSFYLQISDSLDLILHTLTDILCLEGKDNSSHGRAELRSHRCVYTSVLNCLILRRDPEPFLQLPCSLKTVTEFWQTWNSCFTENLSNWLSIWIPNWIGHTKLYFSPAICILKIFWKVGMKFIKGWQQQGNLAWHYFIILYQSAYISYFFFLSVCHNIFYHMNMHFTYSSSLFYCSLWCSKKNFILGIQSTDCLGIFWYVKPVLLKSVALLCLR